jgi:F-type H+-transporting ATPase subunit b
MLDFSVTFLITIVNLTFLYLVLRKILFNPVTKFMENRTNSIQQELNAAKIAMARAEELEAEYKEKIRLIQEDGKKIILAAQEKAEKDYKTVIAQAKADSIKILESSRQEIEEERRFAEKMLRKEAANISIQAASRVIGSELDSLKNRELVGKFLDTVGVA